MIADRSVPSDLELRRALGPGSDVPSPGSLIQAISVATRTTPQRRPSRMIPAVLRVGLDPFETRRITVARLLVLALVGLALVLGAILVGARLRQPAVPGNGAVAWIVGPRLFLAAADGSHPRDITPPGHYPGASAGSWTPASWPSWSPDGRRFAIWATPVVGASDGNVFIFSASGALDTIIPSTAFIGPAWGSLAWSPDGRHLLVDATALNTTGAGYVNHIFRLDLDTGRIVDLTPGPLPAGIPTWMGDGTLIAYIHDYTSPWATIRVITADGADAGRVPAPLPDGYLPAFMSADPATGRLAVAAYSTAKGAPVHLFVVPLDGSPATQLPGGFAGGGHAWSPTGSAVAFDRGSDCGPVEVARPDGSARKLAERGVLVGWSPDGTSLLIVRRDPTDGSGEMVAVRADGSGETVIRSGIGGRGAFDTGCPFDGAGWQPLPH